MHPVQIKMARAALALSADELAGKAGVSPDAILRLEAGDDPDEAAAGRIRQVLEAAGIVFLAADADGPGVRLKSSPATAAGAIALEALNASNDE